SDALYLIDMTGQDSMSLAGRIRGGGASQRMGLITRIRPLAVNIQAAVTSGGTNFVAGNVTIAGNDSVPTGWTGCPSKDSTKAGVRMQVGDSITKTGSAKITGTPPVIHDPTLKDSAFSVYGDVTYTQLAATATVTLPGQNFGNGIGPVVTNGTCDLTVLTNWGSPAHFWGALIAQDTVQFADTVNNFTGGATMLYSKCAILKALNKTGTGSMLRSRGWVQLF